MATLYPETQLEDVVAEWLTQEAVSGGAIDSMIDGGRIYKGFGASDLQTPALVVVCQGSEEHETTGNFNCRLSISARCAVFDSNVRADQSDREAELRDLCRASEIEAALNDVSYRVLGLALRVNYWEPKELSRSVEDSGEFVSTLSIECECYFQ